MSDALRIGLIGYGLAGRRLHAPFFAPAGCALAAVVTSRADEVAADFPGAAVCAGVADLLARDDVEAVVVASPTGLHAEHAAAALEAGKHVLVDKPMALDAASARVLAQLAAERGLGLTCYQNRRFDSDFLTLRRLLAEGALGEVMRLEAHWDRFRPTPKGGWREAAGPGAGVLLDLGPHLLDQALLLFGRPDWVSGDLFAQRGDGPEDGFEITLAWGERRAVLGSSVFAADPRPRFRAFGARGAWVKHGLDPQETQLRTGLSPTAEDFGVEPQEAWGRLRIGQGDEASTPAARGDWLAFYRAFRAMVRDGGPAPVRPEEVVAVLEVLDAARLSAREGRRIPLRAT